ncbi:MAG: helix-turn-helix domain-containing protein, partial [Rhodanobacteraceae bacterium]
CTLELIEEASMVRDDHPMHLRAHAADIAAPDRARAQIADQPETLTLQQAADALNIDRRALTALVDDGRIAATGRGPRRRLRTADVRAFARMRDTRRREASQALADLSQEFGLDRLTSRDLPDDGR